MALLQSAHVGWECERSRSETRVSDVASAWLGAREDSPGALDAGATRGDWGVAGWDHYAGPNNGKLTA